MQNTISITQIVTLLGKILKCPICGQTYSKDQIQVVSSKPGEYSDEANYLVHSDCQKCTGSIMLNVEVYGPDIFSVGTITDLTRKDTNKFQYLKPLELNEVISIHKGIRKFKGNLAKTLGYKKTVAIKPESVAVSNSLGKN